MKTAGIAQCTLRTALVFRPCVEADVEALEWFGMFTHHRSILREAWARCCAGENLMYVVDLWGFPIAQAWVDLEKRREARAALLWAVRVFPLFQGQGIGRFMLEQVERRTEARGMWALELGVEKDNARAQSFYERLGYRHVGELSECYRYEMEGAGWVETRVDQRVMRKELTRGRRCVAAPPHDAATSARARELHRDDLRA